MRDFLQNYTLALINEAFTGDKLKLWTALFGASQPFSAPPSQLFSALLSSPQFLLSSPQLFSALLSSAWLFFALLSSAQLFLLSSSQLSQLLVSLRSSCPLLNVRTTEVPLLNCLWSYPLIGMVVGQSLGYPNNSMVLPLYKAARIGNSDGFTFWPPAMSERAICRCLQGLAEWTLAKPRTPRQLIVIPQEALIMSYHVFSWCLEYLRILESLQLLSHKGC